MILSTILNRHSNKYYRNDTGKTKNRTIRFIRLCVGQGLHDVLNSSKGFKADIVKICVKDRTKKRRIPMTNFTFDKDDILKDSSINLVVELIDDADEAFSIVTTAMRSGKNVVTANKMMVAKHFQ
jgi:homoserine dehydrogenase